MGQCQSRYFRGILKKGMSMYVWASQLIGRRSEGTRPLAGGWLIPADDGVAAASDRGFTLGDGLFETVLVRGGDAPLWPYHEARLREGCRLLRFPSPPPLEEAVRHFVAASGQPDGILRITCTRGPGPRGYRAPAVDVPFCVMAFSPLPVPAAAPWRAVVSRHPVLPHPILSRVKHTSALPRIVAFQEAEIHGADEVITLTAAGFISEGCAANVFWRRGDDVYTPDVEGSGCLPGVGRQTLIRWARQEGFRVVEGCYPLESLLEADEVFFTNAVRGPIPLGELVGHRRWPAPGPFTAQAMAAWERITGPTSSDRPRTPGMVRGPVPPGHA